MITFPTSPSDLQVYSPGAPAPDYVYHAGLGVWQAATATIVGATGPTGPTGAQGVQGPTGPYTDPLTTNGDLLYCTAGSTTRLPIGSNSQILTVVASLPAWAPPAASSAQLYYFQGML